MSDHVGANKIPKAFQAVSSRISGDPGIFTCDLGHTIMLSGATIWRDRTRDGDQPQTVPTNGWRYHNDRRAV